MIPITPELRQAIAQAGGAPVRLEDPETKTTYVLIPMEQYEAIVPLVLDGEPTLDEQRALLGRMGRSIGWDDPEMDVYNDLDPRNEG